MTEWTRKKRIAKSGDAPHILARRYAMPASAADAIKKAGPVFGSQGRALLVATEILIRMEKMPVPEPGPVVSTYATFRMHTRTAQIIETLSREKYGNDRGQVFAACAKVLKMKRIKI
jgi:hypothetical protein